MIAQHEIQAQKQRPRIETDNGVMAERFETLLQASAQLHFPDKPLDDDQPGVGGQALILESKLRRK